MLVFLIPPNLTTVYHIHVYICMYVLHKIVYYKEYMYLLENLNTVALASKKQLPKLLKEPRQKAYMYLNTS